ncbi:hypothetical protein ACLOJK_005239 [Asimina triloba]
MDPHHQKVISATDVRFLAIFFNIAQQMVYCSYDIKKLKQLIGIPKYMLVEDSDGSYALHNRAVVALKTTIYIVRPGGLLVPV